MRRLLLISFTLLTSLAWFVGCEDDPVAPVTVPQVVIMAPADGAYWMESDTVRVGATDPDSVAAVEFLVDGALVHRDETAPYNWFWSTGFWWQASRCNLTVRAVDHVGDSAFAGPIAVNMPWRHEVPELTAPDQNAEFPDGEITLTWEEFPHAADYEVEVAESDDFNVSFHSTVVAENNATLPVDRDARCYWRVRARDASGRATDWSSVRSFEMGAGAMVSAASTAELMDLFRSAYQDRDLGLYDDILAEGFLFFFISAADGQWDKTEDLISTANLFSGEAITNSQGELTRAITSIDVDQFIIRESWRDVAPGHPQFGGVAGVQTALFQCRLVMHHDSGTLTVESDQIFYAAPTTVGGATTWALLGQEDVNKANEDMTWSNIKVLFR